MRKLLRIVYWMAVIPWVLVLLCAPLLIAIEILEYLFPTWSIGNEYHLRILGGILAVPIWIILFKLSIAASNKMEAYLKRDPEVIDKINSHLEVIQHSPNELERTNAKLDLRALCRDCGIKPPPHIEKLLQ